MSYELLWLTGSCPLLKTKEEDRSELFIEEQVPIFSYNSSLITHN